MRLRFPLLALLAGLIAIGPLATAGADSSAPVIVKEAKVVKAAYIYNFAKFVAWTSEEGEPVDEKPITICVLGKDAVGTELDNIRSFKAKTRPIAVLHIAAGDAIPPCHILYICRSEQDRLGQILPLVQPNGVLTVSDLPGFTGQGGMIGFVAERGRVLVEINAERAQAAGIRISSKLLEIARLVPPAP